MKSCVIYLTKIRLPLKLSLLRESSPKSARVSSQHLTHIPNFSRFIFGGVIAERVKAVVFAHRVLAIFAFGE